MEVVQFKIGIVHFKMGIVHFKMGIVQFKMGVVQFKMGIVQFKMGIVHFKDLTEFLEIEMFLTNCVLTLKLLTYTKQNCLK